MKKDEKDAKAKAAAAAATLGNGAAQEKVHLISAGIFKLKNSKKLIAAAAKKKSEEQASSSCSESDSGLLTGGNKSKLDNNNNHNTNNTTTTTKSDSFNNNNPSVATVNALCVTKYQQQNTTTAVVSFAVEDPTAASANKNTIIEISPHASPKLMRTPSTATKATTLRFRAASAGVLRAQSSAISAASSNKERKVTKTLAIVLIVFLVCW